MLSYYDEESGEVVTISEHELEARKLALMDQLTNVQNELNVSRLKELHIRKELIKLLVPSWSESSKVNGKAKVRIGCDKVVNIAYRTEVRIPTADDYKSLKDMLEFIRCNVDNGDEIANNLINNTPTLNWSVYEKLPNKVKRTVDKVVRITSYCPYIELD